jgi:hypothetical protein
VEAPSVPEDLHNFFDSSSVEELPNVLEDLDDSFDSSSAEDRLFPLTLEASNFEDFGFGDAAASYFSSAEPNVPEDLHNFFDSSSAE